MSGRSDDEPRPKDPAERAKQEVEARIPNSRWARLGLGSLLILGGTLGFLPVLGFWMLPLGLLVLSYDLPPAARLRQRVGRWWRRRARDR